MSSREHFPQRSRGIDGQSAIFAMIYGAASHRTLPTLREFETHQKRRRFFAACRGCGNPARNGHCFKCQQAAKQFDPNLDAQVLVVVDESSVFDPNYKGRVVVDPANPTKLITRSENE
jgi:citrate lyase synthetase